MTALPDCRLSLPATLCAQCARGRPPFAAGME